MSQPSWIGRSLSGRYQIESLLGQGGMSAVYRANDPNLKRVVAIKLIHPHLSSDIEFVHRFEGEATAVASLRHPNIVQVYDFNSDQGVYYMVLEFVPGETLHDRLQRLATQGRTLPIDEAIKYTLNICSALEYAHQRGIIHRDIKPANIMLDVYGQAILMDFGIVKLVGGTSHTATGAVLGTARYISPEVIRSEPVDQRSDLYSLGIAFYEMLSGKTPFQSDSAMTLMMMHLNDPVPDPRQLRADIPASLVTILQKSLEKDRAQRYQSAAEMAADLKRALAELENGTVAASFMPPQSRQTAAVPPAAGSQPVRETEHSQRFSASVNTPTMYEQKSTGYTPPPVYNPPSDRYTPAPAPSPSRRRNSAIWFAGLGGGCLLLVLAFAAAGLYFASLRNAAAAASPSPTSAPTSAPVVASTPSLEATPAPTEAATNTPAPTVTLEPTAIPTATYPALYVRINGITVEGAQYVVDYETFGYTEKLPGMHVHFFFNSVPPEQAGMPGKGPWYVYGGPRPFKGYSISQRPAAATQMCALVANGNHSVIADSGNCVDLP